MEHCTDYDATYAGCRECPGAVEVTMKDGTKERICRAGERFKAKTLEVVEDQHDVREAA